MSVVGYLYLPQKRLNPVKGEVALTPQEIKQKEIKAKAERRNAGYAKPDKPDEYQKYLYYLKTGNDASNEYPHNHQLKELKSAKLKSAQLKGSKALLDWVERGPGNVGGRTRGFQVDPNDISGNTWFAGSVGGGIWKTTDAGQNWVPVSDDWPNMAVSCLTIAPSNSQVIYAGTGEGFYNLDAIMGNGIFKSIDGGETWNLLNATEDNSAFRFVNRIAVDKDNENIVYAATNRGIYKSEDGGSSWNTAYQALYNNDNYVRRVQDLRMSPSDSDILIAGVDNYGVIQSFDGGETWKLVHSLTEGRVEICISDLDNDVIFALTSQSNLSMSTDGGDNWVKVSFSGTEVAYLSGQGWYNNTMVAHPSDENKLFIGGVDLYSVTTIDGASNGTPAFDIIDNTGAYFVYGDIEGQYLGGGVKITHENATGIGTVEIRFGAANSQKAHRFTVDNSSALVDNADHVYIDYVDVPFEVWDTQNDMQLMVSFRDADSNGSFNLTGTSVEQLYIHSDQYSESASETIGIDGGVGSNQVAGVYPRMATNVSWDPGSFVNAVLHLNNIELKSQLMTFEKISRWNANTNETDYVHADHHNLIVDTGNGTPFRLISCNDGGVAFSEDGGTSWSSPNDGYNTSQFYGVTRHPNLDRYAGGLQDNGTWMSGENPAKLTAWGEIAGGDGFSTVWNQEDPDKIVGCYYYNTLFGTYDGGQTWSLLSGVHGYNNSELSPFITRITNSKSNPDLLLVGSKDGISTSEDFGLSWDLVSVPASAWSAGDYNPQIAISPVNPRYVWAGTTVSGGQPIALSKNGGKTFGLATTPFTTHSSNISRIVAHPTDENAAFVLFSQFSKPKIFKTDDLGETWTELSGFGTSIRSSNGFPNVAVYSLIVMPHNTDIIWAGTEIGLFESTDGGESWLYANNGLPAVCIWDMKIVGQQVVVGTHGRGVWTVDIPEIPTDILQPEIKAGKNPTGNLALEFVLKQNYDILELYVDDVLHKTYENVTSGTISDEIAYLSSMSSVSVQVKGIVGEQSALSEYLVVKNYQWKETVQRYMNSFATARYDFIGNSFRISKELFDEWAIHSNHPYEENADMTYVLSYPIEVLGENEAFLSYSDIAMVEPGEPGTKFGDSEYWDYVIVEATKDGINWVPLADGYDVNYSEKWKDAAGADSDYNTIDDEPTSVDLFEEHSINLHATGDFTTGDVILIRFRLYSDANATGYGWIIDNLIIQETGTAVESETDAEFTFAVGPNPATDYLQLKLGSEDRGDVNVVIYDMSGKAVIIRDYYKDSDSWSQTIDLDQRYSGTMIIAISVNGNVYKKKIVCR